MPWGENDLVVDEARPSDPTNWEAELAHVPLRPEVQKQDLRAQLAPLTGQIPAKHVMAADEDVLPPAEQWLRRRAFAPKLPAGPSTVTVAGDEPVPPPLAPGKADTSVAQDFERETGQTWTPGRQQLYGELAEAAHHAAAVTNGGNPLGAMRNIYRQQQAWRGQDMGVWGGMFPSRAAPPVPQDKLDLVEAAAKHLGSQQGAPTFGAKLGQAAAGGTFAALTGGAQVAMSPEENAYDARLREAWQHGAHVTPDKWYSPQGIALGVAGMLPQVAQIGTGQKLAGWAGAAWATAADFGTHRYAETRDRLIEQGVSSWAANAAATSAAAFETLLFSHLPGGITQRLGGHDEVSSKVRDVLTRYLLGVGKTAGLVGAATGGSETIEELTKWAAGKGGPDVARVVRDAARAAVTMVPVAAVMHAPQTAGELSTPPAGSRRIGDKQPAAGAPSLPLSTGEAQGSGGAGTAVQRSAPGAEGAATESGAAAPALQPATTPRYSLAASGGMPPGATRGEAQARFLEARALDRFLEAHWAAAAHRGIGRPHADTPPPVSAPGEPEGEFSTPPPGGAGPVVREALRPVDDTELFKGAIVSANAASRRRIDQVEALFTDAKLAMWSLSQEDIHDFIDRWERGQPQRTPQLNAAVAAWKATWDAGMDRLDQLKPDQNRERIADYLSRGCKGYGSDAGRSFLNQVFGKIIGRSRGPGQGRGFGGKPSVLMRRSFEYDSDRRAAQQEQLDQATAAEKRGDAATAKQCRERAGFLEPISENPLEMQEQRYRHFSDYLRDLEVMQFAKDRGWHSIVQSLMPEPGRHVPMVAGRPAAACVIYGPRSIEIPEGIDAAPYHTLVEWLENHGADLAEKLTPGRGVLGVTEGDAITTRYFVPQALWHEAGHFVDQQYGLQARLDADPTLKPELERLAVLRTEGLPADRVKDSFRQYVQTPEEQTANALHAFLMSPEKMRGVAPGVYRAVNAFLSSDPELEKLRAVRPGLSTELVKREIPIAGQRIMGYISLPDPLATALEQFASEGLSSKLARGGVPGRIAAGSIGFLQAIRGKMLQCRLSLSAFHPLDVTLLAQAAGLAEADAKLLNPVALYRAAQDLLRDRLAPPESLTPQRRAAVARAEAGGSLFGRQMSNDVKQARVAWAQLHAPDLSLRDRGTALWKLGWHGLASLPELPSSAVMKYAKNIKLGVALGLQADWEQAHPGAGDAERSAAYRNIRGNVDAAFGQVEWENLFMHRVSKDLLQLALFSPGWTGGNMAMLWLAGRDLLHGEPGSGRRLGAHAFKMLPAVLFTAVAANILYQYLSTAARKGEGELPQSLQDLFEPRTGRQNPDGSAERISLPGPWRDWYSWIVHPVSTALHKQNPAIGLVTDIARNEDYAGRQITLPGLGESPVAAVERRLKDYGLYTVRKFIPLSVTSAKQRWEAGGGLGAVAESLVGITPVAASHTRSAAQNDAIQRMRAAGHDVLTPEQAQRQDLRAAAIRKRRLGEKLDKRELGNTFTGAQLRGIERSGKRTPTQAWFAALGEKLGFQAQTANYRDYATETEKDEMAPILAKHFAELHKQALARSEHPEKHTAAERAKWREELAAWRQVQADVRARIGRAHH
jgi:hypothetical protein